MSHRSRAIALLALVAVLGAGAFAWTRWSAGRERAGERDRLVGAVAAELAKDPLDRSEPRRGSSTPCSGPRRGTR